MTVTARAAVPSPDTKQGRFTAGQLHRIRRMLQAQQAARTAQLRRIERGDVGGANPLHPAETHSLVESVRKAVADIDFALQQIFNGRYGICRGCEQPIALPRLEALPATSLCLPCQRRHERRERAAMS